MGLRAGGVCEPIGSHGGIQPSESGGAAGNIGGDVGGLGGRVEELARIKQESTPDADIPF
ncbi:hypothetical protein [Candidatus Amarolinea dominans]|uniref:hypothetical protein n=1 Tax=Candidatus Amarolinea dominans TaxID=3140696 RepID=UPI0031362B2B|nr:hypothetical protein [Anaerolineae bacterium]